MKLTDIQTFMVAYETKWRSRVDTENPYDANPYTRVGRNEMADWCKSTGVKLDPLLDHKQIKPSLDRLFKRLKREFPGERWDCRW